MRELLELPHNNDVTLSYCNPKRFCGFLVVDGKYVKVKLPALTGGASSGYGFRLRGTRRSRPTFAKATVGTRIHPPPDGGGFLRRRVKGYPEKLPLLYGMDYLTHDIPICLFAPSENYQAWVQYFTKLKNTGYDLLAVVCDDNEAIRMAARYVYPRCIVQLCHVHFLENIRRTLKVRSEEQYRSFVADIEALLFEEYLNAKTFKRRCFELLQRHRDDGVKIAALQYIAEHRKFLTGYVKAETWHHNGCPRTTNLIESCNKQLQGRLKTIQGFESFRTAERWLSAWILARRITPFTDCRGRFKKLNGAPSLENTRMTKYRLPEFF